MWRNLWFGTWDRQFLCESGDQVSECRNEQTIYKEPGAKNTHDQQWLVFAFWFDSPLKYYPLVAGTFIVSYTKKSTLIYNVFLKSQDHTLFLWLSRYDIESNVVLVSPPPKKEGFVMLKSMRTSGYHSSHISLIWKSISTGRWWRRRHQYIGMICYATSLSSSATAISNNWKTGRFDEFSGDTLICSAGINHTPATLPLSPFLRELIPPRERSGELCAE